MLRLEDKKIKETAYLGHLSCLLPIYIVPKADYKSIYAVIAVKYGGACRKYILNGKEYETPSGMAHFLEHKMFDMPDNSNAFYIFSSYGADCNAFTSKDMTAYYFDATKKFNENLELLIRMVMTPYYTSDSVSKERGIIKQEIKMVEDDPSYIAYKNLLLMLFGNSSVSEPIAGTCNSIERITPELLYQCHRDFYQPTNMAIAIVGNVEPEKAFNVAEHCTSQYFHTPLPVQPKISADEQKTIEETNIRTEYASISAPQLLVGSSFAPQLQGPSYIKQKLTAEFTLQLLFGPSSTFYAKNYSDDIIRSDFDSEVEYISRCSFIMLGGESRNPELLVDNILRTFNTAEELVSTFELERVKRSFIGSYLRSWEDFEEIGISYVESEFYRYNPLEVYDISQSIKVADCLNFLYNDFNKNMAISILMPRKE